MGKSSSATSLVSSRSTTKSSARGRSMSPRKTSKPKKEGSSGRRTPSTAAKSSKHSASTSKKSRSGTAKDRVFIEWRELHHNAVQRDFLELKAPAAQLSQALQLACPKALKDADIAQGEFQRRVVRQMVPDNYSGYCLPWPLTESGVHGLLKAVKMHPSVPLHDRYVANILLAARDMFQRMPRVTDISVASQAHTKLIIVGNLNGQLADLLHIWQKHGLPHPQGPQYLFNGGLVDHGENGMEVLILILAFKLLYPNSVHINRGCHEDANANRHFGFFEEIRRKCGGLRMFQLFTEVFSTLPLAAVVDNFALVVHGGLSRRQGVLLDHIRGIPMLQELPNNPTTYEEELFHDIMWSKSCTRTGVSKRIPSPSFVEYGPEVTEAFLKANHLKCVIRSRVIPRNLNGHDMLHNKKLWTVFSASNFCGYAGNYGAVIEIMSDHKPVVHTHWAPPLSSFGYGKVVLGLEKAVKRIKAELRNSTLADIIRQVQLRIALHRQDLYYHFSHLDPQRTGTIGVKEWAQGMTAVLKLQLPWEKYRPELLPTATPFSESTVDYVAFCEFFSIDVVEPYTKWQQAVEKRIHQNMLALGPRNVQTARSAMSNRASQQVDEELERLFSPQALRVTHRQAQEYLRGVGCPRSELSTFLRTMEVAQELNTQNEIYQTFQILAEGLHIRHHSAKDVFLSHDHSQNGALGYTQFINAMHQLQSLAGVHFSDDVLRHIGMAMYNPCTATVDYQQVVEVMKMARCAHEKKVVQHICNTLVKHNSLFRKAFQILDYTGMGYLSIEEVMVGLLTVNTLLMASDKLSDEDIDAIATNVDTEGTRRIAYELFLNSFVTSGENAHRLHSNTNVNDLDTVPLDIQQLDVNDDAVLEDSETDAEASEEEEDMEEAWAEQEPISLLGQQGNISLCELPAYNPLIPNYVQYEQSVPSPHALQQHTQPPAPAPPASHFMMPNAGQQLPPPVPPSLRNAQHQDAPSSSGPKQAVTYGYPFATRGSMPNTYMPPKACQPPMAMAMEESVKRQYRESPPVTLLDPLAEDLNRPQWAKERCSCERTPQPSQMPMPPMAHILQPSPVMLVPVPPAALPTMHYPMPGGPFQVPMDPPRPESSAKRRLSLSPGPSPEDQDHLTPVMVAETQNAVVLWAPSPPNAAVTPQKSPLLIEQGPGGPGGSRHSTPLPHPHSDLGTPVTISASFCASPVHSPNRDVSYIGAGQQGSLDTPFLSDDLQNQISPYPGIGIDDASLCTSPCHTPSPDISYADNYIYGRSPIPFGGERQSPVIASHLADLHNRFSPAYTATPASSIPVMSRDAQGSPVQQCYIPEGEPYTLVPAPVLTFENGQLPWHSPATSVQSAPARISHREPPMMRPNPVSPLQLSTLPPPAAAATGDIDTLEALESSRLSFDGEPCGTDRIADPGLSLPYEGLPSPCPTQLLHSFNAALEDTPSSLSRSQLETMATSEDSLLAGSNRHHRYSISPLQTQTMYEPLQPAPVRSTSIMVSLEPVPSPMLSVPTRFTQNTSQPGPSIERPPPSLLLGLNSEIDMPSTRSPNESLQWKGIPETHATVGGKERGNLVDEASHGAKTSSALNVVPDPCLQRDNDSPVLEDASPGYTDSPGNETSTSEASHQPGQLRHATMSWEGIRLVEAPSPVRMAGRSPPPPRLTPLCPSPPGLHSRSPIHARVPSPAMVHSPPSTHSQEGTCKAIVISETCDAVAIKEADLQDIGISQGVARAMPSRKVLSSFRYRDEKSYDVASVDRTPPRKAQAEPHTIDTAVHPANVLYKEEPSPPVRRVLLDVRDSPNPYARPVYQHPEYSRTAQRPNSLLPEDNLIDYVLEEEDRSSRSGTHSSRQHPPVVSVVRNWRGDEFSLTQPAFLDEPTISSGSPITRSALALLEPNCAGRYYDDSSSTASLKTRSTNMSEHRSIVW